MRSVIQTAVRRTVTVCMVVVIVFAAGILAAQSTPVSLLPDIAVPALGVLVTYPGASAASVEEQVTRPLDDALRSVGGATRLQTYSMDNAAALFFYFDYGVDLEAKSDEIRACIAKLELPAECAEPTLTTVDLNASAVATIAVWREDDDTEKLLADAQTLRGVLAGVEGVGDVVLTGAPADEIAVAPLQGLEMATLLLYETLSMGALDIPLGSYFEDGSPVSVRNVSDAATPEELGSLPVEMSFDRAVWTTLAGLAAQIAELEVQNGSPLTDEQVALLVSAGGMADALPFTVTPALVGLVRGLDYTRVTYDASETGRLIVPVSKIADVERVRTYETYSYYNGRPSVTVEVMAAAGANAVDISEAVRARLDGLHLDSSVLLLDDEAEFINDSIGNILSSLLIGGVLAVAVIFVFLRRFSLSLIISVTMPLSVLAAIAALYLLGVTFNMVSLGGLAVGIGMLVDNSIVVIESITKRRDKGEEAFESACRGTLDVAGSLFASTLTTVCVFVPILFITGLTRECFADLAYAVMLSLAFSLLVALTVIPSLYYLVCRMRKSGRGRDSGPSFASAERVYGRVLSSLLGRKTLVLLLALAVFGGSLALVFTGGTEFLPSIDKGLIEATLNFGTAVTPEQAAERAAEAERMIRENVENIESISYQVGKLGTMTADVTAALRIQLRESGAESTGRAVESIRRALSAVECSEVGVSAIDGVVAVLTSGFSSLSVSIRGESQEALAEIAQKVRDALPAEQFVQISDNLTQQSSEYQLHIDHTRCAEMGVDYSLLVQTLRVGLASVTPAQLVEDGRRSDIRLSFREGTVDSAESLGALVVGMNGTEAIHLSDVAEIELQSRPALIVKENGDYLLTLSAQTAGLDTGTAGKMLSEAVAGVLDAYEGYGYTEDGVQSYLNDAFGGLVLALIISVFLLYAVMACQFESLLKPLIIMLSIPLSFTGGFLALAVSGISLNVVSFIGLIMLMGVIVNNAILMIDKVSALMREGLDAREAILEGCKNRLRPILMTTLTTVLALVPLSLGLGQGGALMQPLGVVVMGGLVLGTLVTLVLIPVLLAALKRVGNRKKPSAEERNE